MFPSAPVVQSGPLCSLSYCVLHLQILRLNQGKKQRGFVEQIKMTAGNMTRASLFPTKDSKSHLQRQMDGVCRIGKTEVAAALLKEMGLVGCVPDVVTCNSLMRGYCSQGKIDQGNLDEMLVLFQEMQRRLVKPDLVVYTILINGMCKSRKVKEAKELLSRLIVEGLKPDVHTYTALVDGLCREGSLIEAQRLFRKMEEDGCMPGSCSYNVLLQGCLQHKDTSKVGQLIHEMADRGFHADAVTRTFLKDLLPGNDSPAIKQLLGLFEGHQGVKVK